MKAMSEYEQKVRDFHTAFGAEVDRPFTADLLRLRRTLIAEEVKELFAEIDRAVAELESTGQVGAATRRDMMKEMADVQYVLSGSWVTFGLPASEVFARVHDSNLSKLGPDGKPLRRDDGKVLKGPDYHPPMLDDL